MTESLRKEGGLPCNFVVDTNDLLMSNYSLCALL